MGRRVLAAAVVLGALAVPIPASSGSASAAPVLTAQAVATNLNDPSMFTVASDGRIFYSERTTGAIMVLNQADGSRSTYFQVPDLCTDLDEGLFGLALDPAFATTKRLYAYAIRRTAAGICEDQVLRLTDSPSGMKLDVLLADPVVGGHQGGRLLIGPDRNLYVSMGDGSESLPTQQADLQQRTQAQNTNSPKGKILRLTLAGGIPTGNPFKNPVFAYGFRNVFGFDFDPANGRLWAVDNGPNPTWPGDPPGLGPLQGCNDELDLVVNGGNYGWGPTGNCGKPPPAPFNTNQDGPSPIMPAWNIEVASGVTGGIFCKRCGLGPAVEGRLLYVSFSFNQGDGSIRAATLSCDRKSVIADSLVYAAPGDPPLSLERGPDGTIYYSDSAAIYRLVGAAGTPQPLVTSFQPGQLRNDFTGWAGMRLKIGSHPLTVTSLGRWVTAGNIGTHTVKLVDATTSADVVGGSVPVPTAGMQGNSFAYAALAPPVTLVAHHTYYLVSQEIAGGDAWSDIQNSALSTTAAAAVRGTIQLPANGRKWISGGSANQALVPPSFTYTSP